MTEHFELRHPDGRLGGCFKYHTAEDARRWAKLIGGHFNVVRVVTVQSEIVVKLKGEYQ